uniref:Uncharacterized protein n=1 Tax=Avena sativa TaxID=4498 RepID=A0ACD6AMI4_AVESA
MALPPSRVPPAPKRHCRGLGSAAMTSTSASIRQAAAVPPSQDAISEILSWLPAKSLCRFRCVSKEWRALVSSPAFVAAQRSRAEPLLVARSTCGRTMQLMDTEGAVVRAVEAQDDGAWIFRASLGGLVCFSSVGNNSGTLVMDLATGKTLLACSEPAAAPAPMYYTGYGFGRAARSGSLMVFRFVLLRPGEQMCEVLALGDGAAIAKWKRTRSPPMMVSLWYSRCSGVTANGALHYLSFGDEVLSFDLANEEWKQGHLDESVHDAEGSGLLLCRRGAFESVTSRWRAALLLL